MVRHAFSFALVPVQQWIAEARRSRDLRAGSALLGWWMATALEHLLDHTSSGPLADLELSLPRIDRDGINDLARSLGDTLAADYNLPNRASGFLHAPDGATLRAAFDGLQPRLVAAWDDLRRDLFSKNQIKNDLWEVLEEPLEDYLRATPAATDCPVSVVWAALPWPRTDSTDHEPDRPTDAEALEAIDRLFRNVKRTRPVRPWPGRSGVGKCNQCGRRDALGPGNAPSDSFGAWQRFNRRLQDVPSVQQGSILDPGERVCPVCLVRRLASYRFRDRDRSGVSTAGGFPSTGDVATAPWRAIVRSLGGEPRDALEKLAHTDLGSEDLGRALLTPRSTLVHQGDPDTAEARKDLEQALERHRREHPDDPRLAALPSAPDGTVALLVFDGDDMGRRVRQHLDRAPTALEDFATRARRRLDASHAARFYLAGDEGLVIAPAGSALGLARGLREDFAQAFAFAGEPITLSMGVVLFSHDQPLQGAIETAHALLARAKRHGTAGRRKNALAVGVQSASGSRWAHVGSWDHGWGWVEAVVDLVARGHLATGWAHDVAALVASLPPGTWSRADTREAAEVEMARLFARRFHRAGRDGDDASGDAPPLDRATSWENLRARAPWRADATRPSLDLLRLVAYLARHTAPAPATPPSPSEATRTTPDSTGSTDTSEPSDTSDTSDTSEFPDTRDVA